MVAQHARLATVRTVFWYVLSWMVCVTLAYRLLRTSDPGSGEDIAIAVSGMAAGLASVSYELRVAPALGRYFGAGVMVAIRALSYILMLAVFVHALAFTLMSLVAGDGPFGFLKWDRYHNFISDGRFVAGVLGLTVMSFVISFIWQVNRVLGPGTLWALLLGRYRRPARELRIFMFLDLRNSTSVAEKLGDEGFNAYKNDFYHDLTEPVLQTRGRIYEYVGDEVVITWSWAKGLRDGNCVRCFFLIEDEVERHRSRYLTRYGVVPQFKAAIHGGPVVTSEIGDLRKNVVHTGDTVNTTSRIESKCRVLGQKLLISASLLEHIPPEVDLERIDLGEVPLRGKESRVHLFGLDTRGKAGGYAGVRASVDSESEAATRGQDTGAAAAGDR